MENPPKPGMPIGSGRINDGFQGSDANKRYDAVDA